MLRKIFTLIELSAVSPSTQLRTGWVKTKVFTLIELLVVIAIIAILITILLPALAMAKKYAYKIDCVNRMKQVGLAVESYRNDYDGWYPPQYGWDGSDFPWPGRYYFPNLVLPYLSNDSDLLQSSNNATKNMLMCPSAGYRVGMDLTTTRNYVSAPGMTTLYNYFATTYFGYGYYVSGYDYSPKKNFKSGRYSSIILAGEVKGINNRIGYVTNGLSNCIWVHMTRTNLLFLDGHVKDYPYGVKSSMSAYKIYWQ